MVRAPLPRAIIYIYVIYIYMIACGVEMDSLSLRSPSAGRLKKAKF